MVVSVIERNCDVTKDNTGGDMRKPNIVVTLTCLLSLEGHREQSMATAVLTDVKQEKTNIMKVANAVCSFPPRVPVVFDPFPPVSSCQSS
mgnify:CR=1 FL=1